MPKRKFPWATNTTLWTEIKGLHEAVVITRKIYISTFWAGNARIKGQDTKNSPHKQQLSLTMFHSTWRPWKSPQEAVIVTDNLPPHELMKAMEKKKNPTSGICQWQSSTGYWSRDGLQEAVIVTDNLPLDMKLTKNSPQVASTVTPNFHRTHRSGRNSLHEAVIVTDNLWQDMKVPMKQQLSRATSTGHWGQEETVSMKR